MKVNRNNSFYLLSVVQKSEKFKIIYDLFFILIFIIR